MHTEKLANNNNGEREKEGGVLKGVCVCVHMCVCVKCACLCVSILFLFCSLFENEGPESFMVEEVQEDMRDLGKGKNIIIKQ